MPRYKIADVVLDVFNKYGYTERLCRDYIYDGNEMPSFSFETKKEDIIREREICREYDDLPDFSDEYLESIALFRKFSEYLFNHGDGIVFHGSALAVDNKGYVFIGKSGAGKSTHARLWRELLGDKVITVNDDKPVIRRIDGKFFVYGTPWNGKHHLSADCKYELSAFCDIRKSPNNSIKELSAVEGLAVVLNQTLRPENSVDMNKLIDYLGRLTEKVKVYALKCNISKEAAELSYKTMSKGENK